MIQRAPSLNTLRTGRRFVTTNSREPGLRGYGRRRRHDFGARVRTIGHAVPLGPEAIVLTRSRRIVCRALPAGSKVAVSCGVAR